MGSIFFICRWLVKYLFSCLIICIAGGEVTAVDAWPTMTVGELKRLVTEALLKDDDELLRRVTVVDLMLGERPLVEDSATIAECGLSNDKAVLAIFKQRCVECVRWQDSQEDLTVADNPVRLIIPDGTTELPSEAFAGCRSIQSVRIPSSVTSIGIAAFSGCTSLAHLRIPESVTSIGSAAFRGCGLLSGLTLPDSVTSLGNEAFIDCTSLTSLIIPASVTRVSTGTFERCSSLGTPVAGLQHELREAWRRKRFHTFLQEARRDARALRDLVVYSAVTQRQTARLFSLATVEERGVMMGAALSTAFYEKVRKCEPAPVCVWCGKGEPAHWLHLAWKCDYFAG